MGNKLKLIKEDNLWVSLLLILLASLILNKGKIGLLKISVLCIQNLKLIMKNKIISFAPKVLNSLVMLNFHIKLKIQCHNFYKNSLLRKAVKLDLYKNNKNNLKYKKVVIHSIKTLQ